LNSELLVASEENKTGTLTLTTSAELTLGAGYLAEGVGDDNELSSKLVLTGATGASGAKLAGVGSVKAGATTITGGNASGFWQVVGAGTVAISVDSIESDAATAILTAGGHADAAVTVTAGTLELTGVVEVKTGTLGKVVLKGDGTDVGVLVLKTGTNPGKLIVDSSQTTADVTTIGSGADFLIVPTAEADGGLNAKVTKLVDETQTKVTAGDITAKVAAADVKTVQAFGYIAAKADEGVDVYLTSDIDADKLATIITGSKTIAADAV
jgi:hypothetical protein